MRATTVLSQTQMFTRQLPLYFAVVTLAAVVFFGIFGELVAPHGYNDQNLSNHLAPPSWSGGTLDHPLGTDQLGRDVLSRIMVGARPTLIIILASTVLGGGLGGLLGIVAGYRRGLVDVVVMRLADASLAFPLILFALLLAIVMGPGLLTSTIAVSIIIWSRFARVLRDEVLSLREREWVLQGIVDGCSQFRTIWRHIIPHAGSTWMVLVSVQLAQIILLDAALSFLGAGVPPPSPTWGGMASSGRELLLTSPWVALLPSLAIMITVLSSSILGDALRDRLDPRLSRI